MEIANIAFHLERSGKHTMFSRHMKKHNFMDKMSGLLDERRGKRSILGRYLNDVVRQTPYIKHEDIANDWVTPNEDEYTGTRRRNKIPGNHGDYMDLNYCGDIHTDSDDSSLVEDADEYIRGSGDGSETPNSEEFMDSVTGHMICEERIVIGAEMYESHHVIRTSNHAELQVRESGPTERYRRSNPKRAMPAGNSVISDHTSKKISKETLYSSGHEQTNNYESSQLKTNDDKPSCHVAKNGVIKACYCASHVSPIERKSSTNKKVQSDVKDVTSLKSALKKKTSNKIKVLFTLYKSRKADIKKSKKLSRRARTKIQQEAPIMESNKLNKNETVIEQNMSQTNDYSEIDNFNFAFCDQSNTVIESRDHKIRRSTFTIETKNENLTPANIDYVNRNETKTELSYLCVTGRSTCEDYAYFNNGFILE